jgi:hypothetical protein
MVSKNMLFVLKRVKGYPCFIILLAKWLQKRGFLYMYLTVRKVRKDKYIYLPIDINIEYLNASSNNWSIENMTKPNRIDIWFC